jgi:Ca2+-binding RTX toxin-like protein
VAVYQFSALADGQALSFNPSVDRLNFDQTAIAAGDLSLVMEGGSLHVIVKSGPQAGKDVFLSGIVLEQIAASNFSFADGSVARTGDNTLGTANDGGANFLSGGAGRDLLMGLGGNDNLQAGDNNDSVVGGDGNDAVSGNNGNDWMDGSAGNDTLNGGGGQDAFLLSQSGAANADLLADFSTAWDSIRLDAGVFSALGAEGRFASGDVRFFAGTAAHDADDRIIFNSATGQVFYDADGNGAGAAQLIATLGAGRSMVAADLWVFSSGGTPPPPPPPPTGPTEGNDSLVGTSGNDTINGLGGNDTIEGLAGADSLVGGAGSDRLVGGDGDDSLDGSPREDRNTGGGTNTLDGGLGNDLYRVGTGDIILADAGGVDTVVADETDWTLGAGLENLDLVGMGSTSGFGNELDNIIRARLEHSGTLDGRGGNDLLVAGTRSIGPLIGGDGNDTLLGSAMGSDTMIGGNGNDVIDGTESVVSESSFDRMDGGAGQDTITGTGTFIFSAAPGVVNADTLTDFTSGRDTIQLEGTVFTAVGFNGRFAAGDARFWSSASGTAHDADDRVLHNTSNGQVWYDVDGNGAASAQLIATLPTVSSLAATDILVVNASGSGIQGGPGNDSLVGTTSNDTMFGFGGNDTLDGGVGADRMDGGAGDDLYFVDNAGDQVVEAENGGIDEVRSSLASHTLHAWVNNLTLLDGAASGTGNGIDNVITGNALNNELTGGDGNDRLLGGLGSDRMFGDAGGDTLDGGDGQDLLTGGAGNDSLLGGAGPDEFYFTVAGGGAFGSDVIHGGADRDWLFLRGDTSFTVNLAAGALSSSLGSATVTGVEAVLAFEGNDHLTGDGESNTLAGNGGNDTLDGGLGNDILGGGIGADTFAFSSAPGAAHADAISEGQFFVFQSGTDRILLDATVMPALGASGMFAAGDARFYAAAGANGGHDADDRVIYNTTTGQLWYDADGSGAGVAQLIATIGSGGFALAATDIFVANGGSTPPPTGGGTISGTPGNDSLTGGTGDDTINGNAGDDTLRGGAGNDSLDGGSGIDSLDGGTGNDIYVVSSGDILVDAGGIDLVYSPVSWSISGAFENLEFTGTAAVGGSGNSMANRITGNSAANTLRPREGNDTVTGGAGADSFEFVTALGANNVDHITDFASGVDRIRLDDAVHAGIGATGNFAAGDGRFWAAAGATTGHDANDRVIYDTATGNLYYDADGSGAGAAQLFAVLDGAPTLTAADFGVI